MKQFVHYMKRISAITGKKYICKIFLINFIMMLIAISSPALVAQIITKMIAAEYEKILLILAILALMHIINLMFNMLNSKIFYKYKRDIGIALRKKMAVCILSMDIKTFSNHKKGEFIQKINKDPYILGFCINSINKYIFTMITNIGIIFYIMYLNIVIGSIYAISFIIILAIRKKGLERKNNYRKKYYTEEEKSTTLLGEILNGIKEIKQLDLNREFDQKAEKTLAKSEELQYNADLQLDKYVKLTNIIQWFANGAIIVASTLLIKSNLMTTDAFITAFMYRVNIFSFADNFTDLIDNMMEFNLISNRIFEIIDLHGKQKQNNNLQNKCIGTIDFKNVTFKYDKTNILKNCSFTIRPNELVAIRGKSGSGKTTILNLIANMYEIDSGEILIDDISMNTLSNTYLRENISMISQNLYLFDMSIKENLKLVKPNATDDEIKQVCKKVGLEEFINSLPEGYNTMIGEGGQTLSGGQKQRIAIARTLLKNTKIILCDEITNALDNKLEQNIISILKELKQNHTIILVTHKEELMNNVDRQYLLENGEVKEYA